jgi:hypothetical protein
MHIFRNAQALPHMPIWVNVFSIYKDNNNIGQKVPLLLFQHPLVATKEANA